MSSGEVLKADKDFTKEVDAAIPEAEKLASVCLLATRVETELTRWIRATPKLESTSCSRLRSRLARYASTQVMRTNMF
jgi:hypothetical protein